MTKRAILDLEPEKLAVWIIEQGYPAYRARQAIEWIYRKKVVSFDQCLNLPGALRTALADHFVMRSLALETKEHSRNDGTIRYSFTAVDGEVVPTVFLPKNDRRVVCISTQVGCPIKCRFCRSGTIPFKRNLSRGEILEQILAVEHDMGRPVSGVLFMGMGEPLLNYEAVLSAVRCIIDDRYLGIGRRHVTLSTVGIISALRQLVQDKPGTRLAISLHGPDDETRQRLVPTKKAGTVDEVLDAALEYSNAVNLPLMIEYVLVNGINDTLQCAQKMVQLFRSRGISSDRVKINLIPYNEVGESGLSSPERRAIVSFQECIIDAGYLVMIRASKGQDIGSACGQLGV